MRALCVCRTQDLSHLPTKDGNNCICSDHCTDISCYKGDVAALVQYGFDAVKLDGCGKEYDLDQWSSLINATGRPVVIENCHWGNTVPTATWCPWNFFRTSGDVRASYSSIVSNLQTTIQFARQNLSRPGCWACKLCALIRLRCAHTIILDLSTRTHTRTHLLTSSLTH